MLNVSNVIKQILKHRNLSQEELAKKCGYPGQSCVGGLLNRGNIRIDNLQKLVENMDCQIIIKDKHSKQEWIIMEVDNEKKR